MTLLTQQSSSAVQAGHGGPGGKRLQKKRIVRKRASLRRLLANKCVNMEQITGTWNK